MHKILSKVVPYNLARIFCTRDFQMTRQITACVLGFGGNKLAGINLTNLTGGMATAGFCSSVYK